VEDPNPKIAKHGIKALQDKEIEVEMFSADLQDVIWRDNEKFRKEKEAEALQAKLQIEKPSMDILEQTVSGTSVTSFSSEAVQKFISESSAKFKYPSAEFNEWAHEFGFIENEEKTNEFKPTGLGIMLFGKSPENSFPQTVFKVEINYGSGKPEGTRL
jgi:ATP-dependent DNA helicase RecG